MKGYVVCVYKSISSEEKLKEYLDSLRERIPVSTIFDGDSGLPQSGENAANLATAKGSSTRK